MAKKPPNIPTEASVKIKRIKTTKKQSRKHSHYEVATNQVVGIIGGWSIVYFAFQLFNDMEQVWIATISSILFFIWSYSRSYIIRRIFNGR